jgi:ATP synthase protein I
MKKTNNELLNGFSTAATIGFYMVSSVIVGIMLGRLTDRYFGIQPWATIVGIVLGMITGMWAIYKRVVGVK